MSKRSAKEWLEMDPDETLILRGTAGRKSAIRFAVLTTLGSTAIYGALGTFVGLFSWVMVPVFAAIFFALFALFSLGLRHQGDLALSDRNLYLRKRLRFSRDAITHVKTGERGVIVTLSNKGAVATQRLDCSTPDCPTPAALADELRKSLDG